MELHKAIEAIMSSDAGERTQCLCSSLADNETCPFCFGTTTAFGRSPAGIQERARLLRQLILKLTEA
jgi:hypothetical protein